MNVVRRDFGGASWELLEDGRLRIPNALTLASPELRRALVLDKDGCVRTRGEPQTSRTLRTEHGNALASNAARFCVPEYIIAAVLITESLVVRGSFSRDVISIRYESGFVSLAQTPRRVSAGLMQTLLSTAREVARRHNWQPLDPHGAPREVALGDLIVPENSIFLGTAYLKEQGDKHQMDPVFMTAAYNAGSVRRSTQNDFQLMVNGQNDRIIKHAAYQNDYLAVMNEVRR